MFSYSAYKRKHEKQKPQNYENKIHMRRGEIFYQKKIGGSSSSSLNILSLAVLLKLQAYHIIGAAMTFIMS